MHNLVAYRRFVHSVPVAINHELVQGGERNISQLLGTGLGLRGLNVQKICVEGVQEAGQITGRRVELNKKLDALKEALAHVEVLQTARQA